METLRAFAQIMTPAEAAVTAETFKFPESSQTPVLATEPQDFDQFDAFLVEYTNIQLKEDEIRYKLASKLPIEDIDAYAINVFDNDLKPPPQLHESPAFPIYFRHAQAPTQIVSKAEFTENFNSLTDSMFANIDMSNFVVAGGAVLSCLLPNCRFSNIEASHQKQIGLDIQQPVPADLSGLNGFFTSDIDLFVVNCTQEEANLKVDRLIEQLQTNSGSKLIFRSSQAVSLLSKHRDVQIIFRIYNSMSEILLGFDIDSAAVCYDFQSQNAYFTPRSHFAILSRTNVLNQLRRSKNYGQRLIKYANRGFQIAIPGFSRNCLVVQKLTKNADLVDQKCHFRTKNEQVYLEGLVRQEKTGNLLCSSEINQIIEAEIGSSVNFLGIDQKFYQQQCRLVGVVLQNTRIENRIQNEKNRMARNLQTEANRGFKQSMAVVQGCVQDDKVGENPVSYNLTKHTETDVLSHQFAFQSDYCIPTSFGFHSQNAIEYSLEHPRSLPNLYIGPYRQQFVNFVIENPGKQDLFTSSFHPDNSYGFYGDLRLFCGQNVFLRNEIATKQSLEFKLFFLNHFCSLPPQIAADIVQSKEEQKKYVQYNLYKQEVSGCVQISQLHSVQIKIQHMRQLIQQCSEICCQRQLDQESKIVIKDNDRQVLRWTWYLSETEIEALDESQSLQAKLAKNYFVQILESKKSGNLLAEYEEQSRWIAEFENTFQCDVAKLFQQVLHGDQSTTVLGQTYNIPSKEAIIIFLNELNLLAIAEVELFEIQGNEFQQSYHDSRLDIRFEVSLSIDNMDYIRQLMTSQLSHTFIALAKVQIQPDLSYMLITFNMSNIYTLNELLPEVSSFDTMFLFYQQFLDMVRNHLILPSNSNLYVFRQSLIFYDFARNAHQHIALEHADSYLTTQLGIDENLVRSMKTFIPSTTKSLELPITLIRQLLYKQGRASSQLILNLNGAGVDGILLPFKIVKTSNQTLELTRGGDFLSTIDLFKQIGDLNYQTLTTPQLYLLGKAIAYALFNQIQLNLTHPLPLVFFRSILVGKFYMYNKFEAEIARFDLSKLNVHHDILTVNNQEILRKDMHNDQFDCICANQEASGCKFRITSIIEGFETMGGIRQFGVLNAVQVARVLSGE